MNLTNSNSNFTKLTNKYIYLKQKMKNYKKTLPLSMYVKQKNETYGGLIAFWRFK